MHWALDELPAPAVFQQELVAAGPLSCISPHGALWAGALSPLPRTSEVWGTLGGASGDGRRCEHCWAQEFPSCGVEVGAVRRWDSSAALQLVLSHGHRLQSPRPSGQPSLSAWVPQPSHGDTEGGGSSACLTFLSCSSGGWGVGSWVFVGGGRHCLWPGVLMSPPSQVKWNIQDCELFFPQSLLLDIQEICDPEISEGGIWSLTIFTENTLKTNHVTPLVTVSWIKCRLGCMWDCFP